MVTKAYESGSAKVSSPKRNCPSHLRFALEKAREVSLARSHEEKSKAARLAVSHRDRAELEQTLKKARQIALARSHEKKSAAGRLAISHRDSSELEHTLQKAREASLARTHEEKSKAARKAALKRKKMKQEGGFMKKALTILAMTISLGVVDSNNLWATYSQTGTIHTEAGNIDFGFIDQIKYPKIYQKISHLQLNDRTVELSDGSSWSIPKIDSIKGWEQGAKLVITQNHATFSTARYALVNLSLNLAVPVNLLREPTPNQTAYYIKAIDNAHDRVTLSDNKSLIVHYLDRGNLTKMTEHDRIVFGVNTGEDKENSPYLLINTAKNTSVRAQLIE